MQKIYIPIEYYIDKCNYKTKTIAKLNCVYFLEVLNYLLKYEFNLLLIKAAPVPAESNYI